MAIKTKLKITQTACLTIKIYLIIKVISKTIQTLRISSFNQTKIPTTVYFRTILNSTLTSTNQMACPCSPITPLTSSTPRLSSSTESSSKLSRESSTESHLSSHNAGKCIRTICRHRKGNKIVSMSRSSQ